MVHLTTWGGHGSLAAASTVLTAVGHSMGQRRWTIPRHHCLMAYFLSLHCTFQREGTRKWGGGWGRGHRGCVLIYRSSFLLPSPFSLPPPSFLLPSLSLLVLPCSSLVPCLSFLSPLPKSPRSPPPPFTALHSSYPPPHPPLFSLLPLPSRSPPDLSTPSYPTQDVCKTQP